jgi:YHS domain-containing protein
MTADENPAKLARGYQDREYYFCALDCKKTFDAGPAKYA